MTARWIRSGMIFAALLGVSGCAETIEPSELVLVMGQIAQNGALNVAVNPSVTRVADRTVRVQAWTVHDCVMARPETSVEVEGDQATVEVWEIRGPCEGSYRGHAGKHDVEVTWPDDVEVGKLVIMSLAWGYFVDRRYEIDFREDAVAAIRVVHDATPDEVVVDHSGRMAR